MKALFVLAVFAASAIAHHQSWVKVNGKGSIPPARFSHTFANYNDLLFLVYGGRNLSAVLSDAFLYDAKTFVWTAATGTTPGPRYGAASFLAGENLYVFGGCSDTAPTLKNDLWKFSFTTKQWTQVSQTVVPPTRYSAVTRVVGAAAFLYGGMGPQGILTDMWSFNIATEEWDQVNTTVVPTALYDQASFAYGQKFYVFGGKTAAGGSSAELWAFDTAAASWAKLTPASATSPAARYGAVGVVFEDHWHLFGGAASASQFFTDTWEYVFATDSWNLLNEEHHPPARVGSASVLEDGHFVLFGGVNGTVVYGDHWELHLGAIHSLSSPAASLSFLPLLLYLISALIALL